MTIYAKLQHLDGCYGYVDRATQEEAEGMSDHRQQRGLLVFIPFVDMDTLDLEEVKEK